MNIQIVVIAKEPVPGRVKTRLCPPCTPEQAARIASAALEDTLDAAAATPALRHVLLLDGRYPQRKNWHQIAQRGDGLASRLGNGFADTAYDGAASLLIGMDTPQVTPQLLQEVGIGLSEADAVLGLAADGGWWALALRHPADGAVLANVPMSRPDTGRQTAEALERRGLRVALAPELTDVDTIADLAKVAAECADSRFARAVAEVR